MRTKYVLVGTLLIALAACGKGNSDSSNPPPPGPAPATGQGQPTSGQPGDTNPAPASGTAPTPGPSPAPPPAQAELQEQKVRKAVDSILVQKYALAITLPVKEKATVTQFAEDMMSCGVSYQGPKCLDEGTTLTAFNGSLVTIAGKTVFYSELQAKGMSAPLALEFTVDAIDPSVKVSKLDVYSVVVARGSMAVADYLKDSSKITPILDVTLEPNFEQAALLRLKKPRDIRELYHVTRSLYEGVGSATGLVTPEMTGKIVTALEKNTAIVEKSDNTQYQEEILSFMVDDLKIKGSALVGLSDKLVKSKSESLKERAATAILSAQPDRDDVKPLVRTALKSSDVQVRRNAVAALAPTAKTLADQELILNAINDRDTGVSQAAIAAATKMTLTDKDLPIVKQLEDSPSWIVRAEAARLLGRIGSTAAITEVIKHMDDKDEDARKTIASELMGKKLAESHVADLAEQYKSQNPMVRKDVSTLLGQIKGAKALAALRAQLPKETNADVKTLITNLIQTLSTPVKKT